jgi:hypothetical protein
MAGSLAPPDSRRHDQWHRTTDHQLTTTTEIPTKPTKRSRRRNAKGGPIALGPYGPTVLNYDLAHHAAGLPVRHPEGDRPCTAGRRRLPLIARLGGRRMGVLVAHVA